jgi:hypothetical protein
MSLKFTLDGSEIAPPQNWKELEVELNFDNNTNRLSTSDFEFFGQTATFINQWVEDGCNDKVGLLEPPVFQIEEVCEAGTFNLLESVLDLRKAEFACDWVKTPIQELGNIDFLTEAADTFSLLLLIEELDSNEIGYIPPTELSDIYYSTLDVPDVPQLMNLSLSTFSLVQQIITTVTAGTDAINAFVGNYPAVGEGIGQMVMNAIQTTILIIQSKLLIKQFSEALIPYPRKHKALKARVGFEKGCEYLGYKFSSTILDSDEYKNLCIIPKKTTQGIDINQPSNQEATGQETFGDWVRDLSEVFNAKITIIGDTVHWERWDYFKDQSTYQVKDVLKEFNGTNADELDYNFVLSYQTDSADLQTFQQFDEAIYSHTVTPLITDVNGTTSPLSNATTKNRILMSNTDDRQFKYGIVGRRDGCYNAAEGLLLVLNDLVNNAGENIRQQIIDFNNSLVSSAGGTIMDNLFSTDVEEIAQSFWETNCRTGYMELATDYIGVKRLCILDNDENLITEYNSLYLSAKYLFYNFHYINSPVPLLDNAEGNQWITYKQIETSFTCEDFAQIKQQGHNYININYKGDILKAKIDSLKFNPFNCTATMDVRIQKKWTCNLDYKDTQQKPAFIRDRYAILQVGLEDLIGVSLSDFL